MNRQEHTNSGKDFDLSKPVGGFPATVKSVLSERRRFFSGIATTGSLKAPLVFAVVCLLASWLLEGIAGYFAEGLPSIADRSLFGLLQDGRFLAGAVVSAILLVLSPLFALLTLYIYSGILHLLVMVLMPERMNFETTLRVYCYASAVALLSWVPIVGGLATLYGLYLLVVGLREVHGSASAGQATVSEG